MGVQISDSAISRFRGFIADNMGLHFPDNRRREFVRGVGAAAREFGFEDPGRCMEWLMSAPLTRQQVEVLAGHLTVGETYLFREKNSFAALEGDIMPGLIRARSGSGRRIRIWDAGCSTGEEPYSVAIMLHRLIRDLGAWNITILATDINPRALKTASKGIYGEWSFRGTPQWVRESYFTRTKAGRFEILPEIRKMVTFSYHNLVDDTYPSLAGNIIAMDIILCCNVLMYFTPAMAGRAVQGFRRTLIEGGWLVVGPNDPVHLIHPVLDRVEPGPATVFRKGRAARTGRETPECAEAHAGPWFQQPPPPLPHPPGAAPAGEAAESPVPAASAVEALPDPYEEALSLYAQGQYADAVAKLGALRDARALALSAKAHANLGELVQAARCCEDAISCDVLCPMYHYLYAMILQEQGDLRGAVLSLRRVLYLDRNSVLAHVGLGNLAVRLGTPGVSRRHFENALSLLRSYPPEEALPESDGMTAGRLADIITSTMQGDNGHEREAA